MKNLMNTAVENFMKDMDTEHFIKAVSDFLTEQKLVGEFMVWAEKWKEMHRNR